MKLRLSLDGRLYSGTWEVVQQESVFEAKVHLSIEKGDDKKDLLFETKEEMNRFEQRVTMSGQRIKTG